MRLVRDGAAAYQIGADWIIARMDGRLHWPAELQEFLIGRAAAEMYEQEYMQRRAAVQCLGSDSDTDGDDTDPIVARFTSSRARTALHGSRGWLWDEFSEFCQHNI